MVGQCRIEESICKCIVWMSVKWCFKRLVGRGGCSDGTTGQVSVTVNRLFSDMLWSGDIVISKRLIKDYCTSQYILESVDDRRER